MKKDIENTNKKQLERKTTISEMTSTLGRIKSRLNEAEDQISNLEDKVGKTPIQSNNNKQN